MTSTAAAGASAASFSCALRGLIGALALAIALPGWGESPHNLLLFVPDGLRAGSVDAGSAPAMARLRAEGVDFANSHSVFPTSTTANAAAFATGHLPGDSGNFGNAINAGFLLRAMQGSPIAFLESEPALRELSAAFGGNYLHEPSILGAASAQYAIALLGKLGPVAVLDLAMLQSTASDTLLIDDASGHEDGVALSPEWQRAFAAAAVPSGAPGRGENARFGSFREPGTRATGALQQQYLLDVALKVVLPGFRRAGRPFVLVYWSRDPDGTLHNQGDSFRSLAPGINGPTGAAALRSADGALAALEQGLKDLGLFEDTNIIVAADHGFSTIAKQSRTSPAAHLSYADVNRGELPPGFLAIDLTLALRGGDPGLRLFDPDRGNAPVDFEHGEHSVRGSGIIGTHLEQPQLLIAANGGADLLYLPDTLAPQAARRMGRELVRAILKQDYASGVFVDEERLGVIPGALSLASIGLTGAALTPRPAVLVNFRSFAGPCGRALHCAALIADTPLQVGQGMHGSFSRADTWNFMAARGPDFRRGWRDPLPVSNADVGQTLAHLLGVRLVEYGVARGRVLEEALQGASPQGSAVRHDVLASRAGAGGQRTLLRRQTFDGHVYLDAAGFAGRTVGLEAR